MTLLPRHAEHGWTPYIWLIYVGPYVLFPFLIPPRVMPAPLAWLVWALGLVAFLALYFRGYWVDGTKRVPVIIGLGILGVALSGLNPGAAMFFTYAAAFVGGAITSRYAGLWIGGLTLAGVMTAYFAPWQPYWIIAGVALMTPIIGFVNLHYVEERRRDASLKLVQSEIARLATLAERERIAGDLHDLLGHTLSVIVLKSELAAKLMARDVARATAEIVEVERISREALTEVRRAVQGFRTATLPDELIRARAVLETAGVAVDVHHSTAAAGSAGATSPQIEHAAAMILREAVTNVVRHARASRCRISAGAEDGMLIVQIEDDGIGGRVIEGAGIESMRARAREIGGSLEHRSDRGVTVTLRVPRSVPA